MATIDPTSYLADPSLGAASSAAANADSVATKTSADAITLPDLLKQTLNDKFTTNNPLVTTRESQLKDYLNTTTRAPLDYTAKSAGGNSDFVFSPLQQDNLINGRRTAALAPLTSTNWLLGQNTGGIQNIIDAASRAAQAEATSAQGRANSAHNIFQDLLAKLKAQADAAAEQQKFTEGVREFNVGQKNKGAANTPLYNIFGGGGSANSGVPSSFKPLIPGQTTNSQGKLLYGPGF